MSKIFVPPVCKLENLNHLFIELTEKNCNQHCKQCYIDFPFSKNVKDFIQVEKIKQALNDTAESNLKCIYLTGAEPMTHPEFNSILRLCLKRSNVCIFTNATFINEKKARFLKRVEDESEFQIIFKLSFASYDEIKNDNIRFRGAFRQNMFALKCLDKYDFTTILCINNYYNEDTQHIKSEFNKLLKTSEINNAMIQVTQWIQKNTTINEVTENETGMEHCDCKHGRLLTQNGVFTCPFLTNDYRGRMGSSLKDFSHNVRLETQYCSYCIKNNEPMFSVNII